VARISQVTLEARQNLEIWLLLAVALEQVTVIPHPALEIRPQWDPKAITDSGADQVVVVVVLKDNTAVVDMQFKKHNQVLADLDLDFQAVLATVQDQ
jgi:hypothetical protein